MLASRQCWVEEASCTSDSPSPPPPPCPTAPVPWALSAAAWDAPCSAYYAYPAPYYAACMCCCPFCPPVYDAHYFTGFGGSGSQTDACCDGHSHHRHQHAERGWSHSSAWEAGEFVTEDGQRIVVTVSSSDDDDDEDEARRRHRRHHYQSDRYGSARSRSRSPGSASQSRTPMAWADPLPDPTPDKPAPPAYSFGSRTGPLQIGQLKRDAATTPGPGAYTLPAERSGPAFSMGARVSSPRRKPEPGPGDYHGSVSPIKARAPAFSLAAKPPLPSDTDKPGPSDYLPRAPADAPRWTMGQRIQSAVEEAPGPADYGDRADTRRAPPAYTFGVRFKEPTDDARPAPNAYAAERYLPGRSAPAFKIAHRHPERQEDRPAPNQYDAHTAPPRKSAPQWTMGAPHPPPKPSATTHAPLYSPPQLPQGPAARLVSRPAAREPSPTAGFASPPRYWDTKRGAVIVGRAASPAPEDRPGFYDLPSPARGPGALVTGRPVPKKAEPAPGFVSPRSMLEKRGGVLLHRPKERKPEPRPGFYDAPPLPPGRQARLMGRPKERKPDTDGGELYMPPTHEKTGPAAVITGRPQPRKPDPDEGGGMLYMPPPPRSTKAAVILGRPKSAKPDDLPGPNAYTYDPAPKRKPATILITGRPKERPPSPGPSAGSYAPVDIHRRRTSAAVITSRPAAPKVDPDGGVFYAPPPPPKTRAAIIRSRPKSPKRDDLPGPSSYGDLAAPARTAKGGFKFTGRPKERAASPTPAPGYAGEMLAAGDSAAPAKRKKLRKRRSSLRVGEAAGGGGRGARGGDAGAVRNASRPSRRRQRGSATVAAAAEANPITPPQPQQPPTRTLSEQLRDTMFTPESRPATRGGGGAQQPVIHRRVAPAAAAATFDTADDWWAANG